MLMRLLFLAILLLTCLQALNGQRRPPRKKRTQKLCQSMCDRKSHETFCAFGVDKCWAPMPECEVTTIQCFASLFNEPGLRHEDVVRGPCTKEFSPRCDKYNSEEKN